MLILAMMSIGWYFGRDERSTSDFFLGGRRVPRWVACVSFVATEVSAMTIIAVPAIAYMENWQYAQFYVGASAARLAIAYLFIPAFYKYECVTIYQFLKHRFGPATQYGATAFFLITRLFGSGVRLTAAALAISVLTDCSLPAAILGFTVLSAVYISFGGIKAVVWTNVLQALVFAAAGLATVAFVVGRVPGGVSTVLEVASAGGRLSFWNWGPSGDARAFLGALLRDPNIAWVALVSGFFGTMAAFGTDQDLMQRLLAVETREDSQRSLLWTIAGSTGVVAIFLAVGTCLYAYYAVNPALPLPARLDGIYPHFVAQAMPPLLRGLILSAVVMASIDLPLISISAAFVTDLYRPLWRPSAPEKHYLAVSRGCVAASAVLLAVAAFAFSAFDRLGWLALKISSVTQGSLLGVFLLGLLTTRKADRANVVAMVVMALLNLGLLIAIEMGWFTLGWSWLVLIGTSGTIALAWAFSPRLDKGPAAAAALLCILFLAAPARAEFPALEFQVAGKPKLVLSLEEMKKSLKIHQVEVTSTMFAKGRKRYEAFALRDVLRAAYGDQWRSKEFSDVVFHAVDGYGAMGPTSKLREEGAFLAFRDLEREDGWEPVTKAKEDPAPFFLVWTGRKQRIENAYPWPWQLARLNLVHFADQYPGVLPKGAKKSSAEYRGFTIFKNRCMRCHAIGGEGGKVGPDLREAADRSKTDLFTLIREPGLKHPAHPDLAERDLEALYRYLRLQGAAGAGQ